MKRLVWSLLMMALLQHSSSFVLKQSKYFIQIATQSGKVAKASTGRVQRFHIHSATAIPFEEAVKDWLERVVIGWNLCPFADLPVKKKELRIEVVESDESNEILSIMKRELFRACDEPGTTLVVCPNLYPSDFQRYLDVLARIESELIELHALEGKVQVAPFHPLFQFQGSTERGTENWTNRSPYPIFHILREDEVSKAVEKLDGDAGKVWMRNVDLLEAMELELGATELEKFLTGKSRSSKRTQVSQVLRRFRLQLNISGDN